MNNNSDKNGREKYGLLQRLAVLFPPTLFLVFTFAVYMPSSLYLSNIDEFAVDYDKLVPVIIAVACCAFVAIYVVGALFFHRRLFDSYVLAVFSIALGFYVQGNFLNPAFTSLNGTQIDWNQYRVNGVVSIVAWLICIVVPQIIYIFKKNIIELVARWGSFMLTAMQLVSLIVIIMTTQKTIVNDFAVTKNGEFELSTGNNTVMFVVDTLDASWFEEMVLTDDYYRNALKDFTYFQDAVAGGSPTVLGIPTLLTGEIDADAEQDFADFYKEAYGSSNLFSDIQAASCQVKLYTEYFYLDYCDKDSVDNLKYEQQYIISSQKGFFTCLYKLVSFYSMPQFLKQTFWLYTGDFSNYVTLQDTSSNLYTMDDAQFYKDFVSHGITTQSEKDTFVMYHLNGAHGPYVMDEDANAVPENSVGIDSQIRGTFKIISEYIDALKKKGLYDNTTFIITADHGGVDLYQNPAVLVKERNANHDEIVFNQSKISFKNLNATIAASCLENAQEYGEDVFHVGEKNVIRFHVAPNDLTANVWKDDADAINQPWSLIIIPADAKATDLSKFEFVRYSDYEKIAELYGFKK